MSSWTHWHKRITAIANYQLREFPPEVQVRIFEPLARKAIGQLGRDYYANGGSRGDAVIALLESELRSAAAAERQKNALPEIDVNSASARFATRYSGVTKSPSARPMSFAQRCAN